MAERWLDYLRDHISVDGAYLDPQLKTQRHPAVIGDAMLRQVKAMVGAIRWTDADIERCLGEYLTEPRAGVVFKRARHVSAARFASSARVHGLRLALPSRMLLRGAQIFINGETCGATTTAVAVLRELADTRRLSPGGTGNMADNYPSDGLRA